jgi:DNA polymerase-3 subunit epsilon
MEILSSNIPKANRPAFAIMLEQARRKTARIWAEQSPFELKETLKKRGYTFARPTTIE